jgi:hypothetical protein
MNARASENYLAIAHSASKSVEIFVGVYDKFKWWKHWSVSGSFVIAAISLCRDFCREIGRVQNSVLYVSTLPGPVAFSSHKDIAKVYVF